MTAIQEGVGGMESNETTKSKVDNDYTPPLARHHEPILENLHPLSILVDKS